MNLPKIKLEYKHIEKVKIQAVASAKAQLRLQSQVGAYAPTAPIEVELLGCWRVIEMVLMVNNARSHFSKSIDDLIIFDAIATNGTIYGRWERSNVRIMEGLLRGAIMDSVHYSMQAVVISKRQFRAQKIPLTKFFRRRGLSEWFIPEMVQGEWSGYEMTGTCKTGFGDKVTFKAIRVDNNE